MRLGPGRHSDRPGASHQAREAEPARHLRSGRTQQPGFSGDVGEVQSGTSPGSCGGEQMNLSDFLSIKDLSPFQVRFLLAQARHIKLNPELYREALKGKTLAMIFEKPSLRS